MIANTKQVRNILRILNISANWTEKSKGNKDKSVRIVIAEGGERTFNTVKQALSDVGYTNRVTHTQGFFIRIKTYMQ